MGELNKTATAIKWQVDPILLFILAEKKRTIYKAFFVKRTKEKKNFINKYLIYFYVI